ncbi:NmrA family NAD(P)-binding protein [Paenibacillus sp. FSL R7-0337]|uniref:NmrA family NAD(P)-binding protein n=1 Tax=Paenibacillus sp. FSL R7-0337 TaxID=1926588 RepID=UPI00096E063C|nr:NmrA family NAD(P)-binding protein [Paenibacillus sp. FSL R7-0337]OMG01125.1 NAD(P)-dependent oxidoreductase [Paenibacillus sp. FSL R7-0337]
MTIMITGAAGQLGRLIIEQLRQRLPARQIVVGVRRMEQAVLFRELGIEVRKVDYDLPETLDEAFHGISRLLLISSSHTDDDVRLAQHKRVIDAAKRGGVRQLLYTGFAFSQQSTDSSKPGNVHALTEQAILESGLGYTFLRNGLYMDFLGVLGLKEAISSGQLATAPGEWRFNSVTRADLALATAAALGSGESGNQVYELAASRTWDFADLAEVLTEVAGKPVVHVQDASVQHWIYTWLRKLDTASTSGDLERLMGRPVTPLRDSILPFIV